MKENQVEAEFLALGVGGEEVVFAPFYSHLKNSVFFSGYFGDTVWKKQVGGERYVNGLSVQVRLFLNLGHVWVFIIFRYRLSVSVIIRQF